MPATLRFRQEFVDPIVDGEKFVTARYRFERVVEEGEPVELQTTDRTTFATAEVVLATTMPAASFVRFVDVFGGHEAYADVDDFLDELGGYYEATIDAPSTPIDVFGFAVNDVVDDERGGRS